MCVRVSVFSLFFIAQNSNPLCHIEFPSSISVSLWLLLSSSEIMSFKLNVCREKTNEQMNKEEEEEDDNTHNIFC